MCIKTIIGVKLCQFDIFTLFLPFEVCPRRPPALPPYRTQGHHSLYSMSRSPFHMRHKVIAKARVGEPLWAAQSSCSTCTSCPQRVRAVGHPPHRSPAPPPSSSYPRWFENLWNWSLDWSVRSNMVCFVFITTVPYQRGIMDFTAYESRLKRYTGKCSAFARCLEAKV